MNTAKKLLVGIGVSTFAFNSHAALDTTDIQTAVLADLTTVSAYGFAILTASLAISVGIKLVKKYTMKAT
jgi:hypothetical protein